MYPRLKHADGGKGERARICRKCRRMPREKRDALMREREILGFLEQSHISPKNLVRLRTLGRSENTRIAGHGAKNPAAPIARWIELVCKVMLPSLGKRIRPRIIGRLSFGTSS
jgi:hypothetical protein